MADVSVDPSAASQVFASYGSNGGVSIDDVDVDAGVYDIVAGVNVEVGPGSVSGVDEAQIRAIVGETFDDYEESLGDIVASAVASKLTGQYLTSIVSPVASDVVSNLLSDPAFLRELHQEVSDQISSFLGDVIFKSAISSAVSSYMSGTEFAAAVSSYVANGIASYVATDAFSERVEAIVLDLFGGGDEEF